MRAKIKRIHKKDAFYPDRKRLIGMVGEWKKEWCYEPFHNSGSFVPDDKSAVFLFYAVQMTPVKQKG